MDASTVAAVGATVIAVASLAISVTEARATRHHNRLSVRPLLELRHIWIKGQSCGLRLANNGLGPAIVYGAEITLDGVPLGEFSRRNVEELRESLTVRPALHALDGHRFLTADFTAFLLSIDEYDPGLHEDFRRLVSDRLTLEIHYESLYGGERFVASFPRNPRELRSTGPNAETAGSDTAARNE